jgi:hypothetical protein
MIIDSLTKKGKRTGKVPTSATFFTRHGHEYLTHPAMWTGKLSTRSKAVNALAWFGCVALPAQPPRPQHPR